MREILFRGKTDKGEWVQGVPFFEEERCYIIEDLFICDEYDCTGAVNTMVIPETVGQYTGLTDKNGKKIFEGDVVLFSWGDDKNRQPFYIEFVDGEFRATPKEITQDVWSIRIASYAPDFEVIGNIHDNPELLKGGEG